MNNIKVMNYLGHQVNIYKQDPTVGIGIRKIFLVGKIKDGPEDNLIKMIPIDENSQIKKENFLVEKLEEKNIDVFNRMHTFAVARMVLTMYEHAFFRLGTLKGEAKGDSNVLRKEDKGGKFDFRKKWGKQLEIDPCEFVGKLKAIHYSASISIGFGYKDGIYCCQSFDIVAHEVGHAVLRAIWKENRAKDTNEIWALSEAFSDLTVLFSILNQMDMCEAVIAYSKGDLLGKNFLSSIAEQYGMAKEVEIEGKKIACVRDLSQKKIYKKSNSNPHDFSLVFSTVIYHFLVHVFKEHAKPDRYNLEETLFRVARFVNGAVLGAYYLSAYDKELTFKSVGKKIVKILKNVSSANNIGTKQDRANWGNELEEMFIERKIPWAEFDVKNKLNT